MRHATARWSGLLGLLLALACSAPRTAGKSIEGTYHPPSAHWSVEFPFEPSACRVEDRQFPSQENVLFAPKLPFGLGVYQIAVTHSEPPANGEQGSNKDHWFEQLLRPIMEAEGETARLIADEHVPGDRSECWMRIYQVGRRYELLLLRPLPPIARDGVPGAVLFSLTCSAPPDRPRLGEGPPVSLPLHSNWARLVEWSESFVWHVKRGQ
ncbi:MAG: hypothetical protein ACI8QZ_004301 [Chlamydiales bacterium]|jgi:hypothetical protein